MVDMKYELAKQLKDAGYEMDYNLDDFSQFDKRTAHIHLHLDDLIEACGEDFYGLFKKTLWVANAYNLKEDEIIGTGTTPEEAVAKLWLALNNHSTLTD